MHSPKSSRASKPSLANTLNLSSTFRHSSSVASPDLLMNLKPFKALCALDLVRSSFTLIFRAFRAVTNGSSTLAAALSTDADDIDRSHGNFLRILDVIERLRATPPPLPSPPAVLDDGEAFGAEDGAGATLQSTTASFSSSSVISTSSL